MKRIIIILGIGLFFNFSCKNKEQEVLNVSFTPCKNIDLRSSIDFSEKVNVEFTDKGAQITYYNFEVSCDFTTVNVTHTFVNGVLNIIQQVSPNQADCVCYSDVSYAIDGILQSEVNVIFINGMQVYCYNDKPQEPCHCIMDTLKGEWRWIKTYGGWFGDTSENEYKSTLRVLNQNEDSNINYEVFVKDTLFHKGRFQLQEDQWGRLTANIKLFNEPWRSNIIWSIYFFNFLESEYNDETGRYENIPSKNTITFWDGRLDGYYYIYKKINEEE